MIKQLLLLCWISLSINNFSAAQSEVYATMEKHGLDTSLLNPLMANNAMLVAHQLTRTVTTDNGTKIYKSKYDPSGNGLERWQLFSVNGKTPSKKELKAFDKEHEFQAVYKINPATLRVAKEDSNEVHVNYQYDPATVDTDHNFLNDCLFTFIINLHTKKLERITQKNLKELKVKIAKMVKLTGESTFTYNEKISKYLITNQEVVAVIRLIGSQTALTTNDVYMYPEN